jgi:hypothetical protein
MLEMPKDRKGYLVGVAKAIRALQTDESEGFVPAYI